ncbi:hypothetical protein [Thioalkalivibrio sp. ALJ16]|uniref:hypothetical protein n=1 Tax=Thioalkalivibrio sp. ALJ16 TaxID=1158762 RepID=UPI0003789C5A|nr:hypothetical protein [Thioalkalivibrio sp. ALJ16]
MRAARVGELGLALLILLPLAASGYLLPQAGNTAAILDWLTRATGVLALTLILLAAVRQRPALWVGAGIGIAPFVSAVRSLAARGEPAAPPVQLIYAVNTRDQAPYAIGILDAGADADTVE